MRLLVYNIAYGTGSPGTALQYITGAANYLRAPERYFRAIANLVRHYHPDVAGFLETDHGSFRTRGTSQIDELAKILGTRRHGEFFSKYAPGSYLSSLPYYRHQSNALLIRDHAAAREWAEFMPCGTKRLVLACEYQQINIFLVHLALTASIRRRQLDFLATLLKPEQPVIICGDFNTFAGASELTDFLQKTHLISANTEHQSTYPARRPVKELDYVLYSPHLRLKRFRIIRFPGSDHLPLLAEFE